MRGEAAWSAVGRAFPAPVGVAAWIWAGLLFAAAGAAIGHPIGLRYRRRGSRSTRPGFLGGAIVAVAGALLAPVVVRLGAEDSTVRYDEGTYGGIGPSAAAPGRSGILQLPAAGRYAILAVGSAPQDPACLVGGPGPASRRAQPVSIPPADYGSDAATYAWVASFTVAGPGTYSLTCRAGDEDAGYTVGEVPRIRGVVGALIHWPLVTIWLLGSVPGVLILASRYRRRAGGPETVASG